MRMGDASGRMRLRSTQPAAVRREASGSLTPFERPCLQPEPSAGIPADLSEWVLPTQLAEWIEEEMSLLDWSRAESPAGACLESEYPRILALLCFAYATRVFDDAEIIRACRADTPLRFLCRGQVPFAAELDWFRRKNRRLLQRALFAVFSRVLAERNPMHAWRLQSQWDLDIEESVAARLDVARHLNSNED